MSACYVSALKMIIITIYRCPTGDFFTFLNTLEDALSFAMATFGADTHMGITGDFNVDFGNETSSRRCDILHLVESFGAEKTVLHATRRTNISASCIDNIFTTCPDDTASVIPASLSDHHAIVLTTPAIRDNKPNSITRRIMSARNSKTFYESMAMEDWTDVITAANVNDKLDKFLRVLLVHFEMSFPKRNYIPPKRGRIQEPELNQLKETVDMMHDYFSQFRCPEAWQMYITYKKRYLENVRSYIEQKIVT